MRSNAGLLSEVCSDVGIEPTSQPLQGEKFRHKSAITDEEAQLDFVARRVEMRDCSLIYVFLILMLQKIKSCPSQVCINTMKI